MSEHDFTVAFWSMVMNCLPDMDIITGIIMVPETETYERKLPLAWELSVRVSLCSYMPSFMDFISRCNTLLIQIHKKIFTFQLRLPTLSNPS